MPNIHLWRLKVRSYEIDRFGHVNNAIYPNYLEEAATQASTAAGYSWEWYMENQAIWIVRKWMIRYLQPAFYGDELEVATWVSDFRRVQSHRDYVLTRLRDGEKLLRARTNWVFVDRQTLQPKRIFPEFEAAFGVSEQPMEDLGIHIKSPSLNEYAHEYICYRDVQNFEVDVAQHVHNGHYFRWIDHAYNQAIESVGWSLERQLKEHQFAILAAGSEVEYFKPAHAGDRIKIVSRVVEMGRVRGAWIHEIRHAESDELLVRGYVVGAFVDMSGQTPRPTRIPPAMGQSVLSGIPS